MKYCGAAICLLVLTSVPSSAAVDLSAATLTAQTSGDAAELQAYTLTEPVMTKVVAATRLMAGAAKDDADVQRLRRTVTSVMGKTLTEIESTIEQEPLVASALRQVGLSNREFAKFMLTFFQASMPHNMQKSGAVKEPPAGANMDNLKFVETHQAQVNALIAEFQSLTRKSPELLSFFP